MPRPKKYKTQAERKAAISASNEKSIRTKRIKSRFWRLVIPAIEGYGINPPKGHPPLEALKAEVLDALEAKEGPRGLEHWCVAWQTHSGSGLPHLDILLGYSKGVLNAATRYDYLFKHGNLTRYKKLNAAIVEYGTKEDPSPLSNIDSDHLVLQQAVKADMYSAMEEALVKDPFSFKPLEWLNTHDLFRAASKTAYTKNLKIIRDRQAILCYQALLKCPGIAPITPKVIKERLSQSQYRKFNSWSGYGTIVDHINQIPEYGFNRPHKTSNLLLVGRPNTGKTTLGRRLSELVASYPLGVRSWFPSYSDDVYSLMRWEEFTLSTYKYDLMLRLLEGEAMQLPIKGGHIRRHNNQLIIMTSNWSLQEHICRRFYHETDRAHARLNLAPRVTEVIIPKNHDLFILLKLLKIF